MSATFVTRFAPSPTGLLHRGHAFSALTAHEAARAAGGRFLLRVEDIDAQRCRPEHEAAILEDLAWLGLAWEEPVRRQSEHLAEYEAALENLRSRDLLYRCFRTRREVLDEIGYAPHGPAEPFLAGPLSDREEERLIAEDRPYAWRLSLTAARKAVFGFANLSFTEEGEGPDGETGDIAARPQLAGDVVLGRKDLGVAYHLAVVVDDALQGVTHVIRGEDLFEAAHIQRLLQELLGLPAPVYRHHRLLVGPDGKRFAKRDRSQTLRELRAKGMTAEDLRAELGFPMIRSRTAAVLALLAGACAIGLAPIFVRLADTGPAAAGFWRMALALPMLAPFALRRPAGEGTTLPDRTILLAGVFFALDLTFWHNGIMLTSVVNATVLANLTPIFVTIAAWWLLRETPTRGFLVGLALGVAGAVTMALAHGTGVLPGRNPPLGDALSLATSVWYAGYFLCVRKARQTRGTMAVMFWSSLVAAGMLLVVSLAFGEDLTPGGLAGWAALAGLALVHVAGQGTLAWALGRLPAATASVVVLIQPVVTAGLGWVLFSEAVGPVQALGAVAVLGGAALAQWAAARNAPA